MTKALPSSCLCNSCIKTYYILYNGKLGEMEEDIGRQLTPAQLQAFIDAGISGRTYKIKPIKRGRGKRSEALTALSKLKVPPEVLRAFSMLGPFPKRWKACEDVPAMLWLMQFLYPDAHDRVADSIACPVCFWNEFVKRFDRPPTPDDVRKFFRCPRVATIKKRVKEELEARNTSPTKLRKLKKEW